MENLPYQLVVIDHTTRALLLVDNSGEIIAQISYPAGCTPTELVLAPDQITVYLPIIDASDNGGLFIANLKQQSIYRLPMKLPQPIQFTLSPDGIYAYLADPAGMLYSLTINTMSLKSWGTPAKACCVGLSSDRMAVYGVWEHGSGGSLAVFSLTGELLIEHTLPGIPTNITLDNEGHILIPFTTSTFTIEGVICFNRVLNQDHTLAILPSQRCIYPYSTSPSAAYPSHIATCSNEHIAYVVNEENDSITVIDSHTAAIIRHIKLGRSISCLHILPGAQFGIGTSHILGDLSLIDLHNGRLLSVTDTKRELLGYIAVLPTL